jgi:hypothetical protein
MAQNNLELIGILLFFIFGVTMIYQGYLISNGKYGYKHCEREQKKSENVRRQVENLLKDK